MALWTDYTEAKAGRETEMIPSIPIAPGKLAVVR